MKKKVEKKRKSKKVHVVTDMYLFYSKEEKGIHEAEARKFLTSLSQK